MSEVNKGNIRRFSIAAQQLVEELASSLKATMLADMLQSQLFFIEFSIELRFREGTIFVQQVSK